MLLVVAVKTLAKVTLVAVLAAAAGCGGSPLRVGDGGANGSAGHGGSGQGGTAGQGGGGGSASGCSSLDETSCTATPGCTAQHCQICPGPPVFAGCTPPGEMVVACGPCQLDCSALDEAMCNMTTGCTPAYCADCSGAQKFAGCGGPSDAVACPAYACPAQPASCSGLDETSCNARSDCQAGYCTGCSRRTFVGCGDPGTAFACVTGCAVPGPCASETTLAGCEARTDCHAVLASPGSCDCPIVVQLDHCADGAKATCTGTPTCHRTMPYCETPDFVVSYTADCYEGCVRATDCAP